MKWTKTKDESIADGYGRNFIYESGDWTVVPGEPTGWFLSFAGTHVQPPSGTSDSFRTLRDAKAHAEHLHTEPDSTDNDATFVTPERETLRQMADRLSVPVDNLFTMLVAEQLPLKREPFDLTEEAWA